MSNRVHSDPATAKNAYSADEPDMSLAERFPLPDTPARHLWAKVKYAIENDPDLRREMRIQRVMFGGARRSSIPR
ncbi:hypothetical protein CYMTET_36732 [Cymbomonas tetramitiformis]|uniref:Uncharacterized protein n=1 Tax=Cymbomonas tetramitiformis TaxID=36881 RepID=A0AAE0CHL0_9CHLO|nr:hypothetical protein CYMTET_36732 [Cymbomonas tetramitiformis]